MKEAKIVTTYIDDLTGDLSDRFDTISLQYLGVKNCKKVYKIVSSSNKDFMSGELYENLNTNEIYLSIKTSEYNKNLSYTIILKKCGKKYTGVNVYTNGLQGETSCTDFFWL